jgi:IS30 family transposase
MRPNRIFTPTNLLRIQQMAVEGSSAIEIAKTIGSTPGSVRVACSRHKIKIGRRRQSILNAVSKPVRPSSDQAIVAHLPASLSSEFQRKAEQLQISASVLASRLLEAIVVSNIYEAVLDDKD